MLLHRVRLLLLVLLTTFITLPAAAQICFSTPATFIDSGIRAQVTAVADFNGDGKTDLLTLPRISGDSLTVYLGDNHGHFPTTVKTLQSGREIFVGDFNGDGKKDLAIVVDSSIDVLLGNGNATFQPATHIHLLTSSIVGITGADFDGDGRLDLVTSLHVDGKLLVLKGNGLGGFTAPVTYPTVAFPMYATAADLNGDGKPDLICGSETIDSITVMINNGSGGFGATQYIPHGRTVFIKTADINGDSKIDLVARTGTYSSDSIRISFGNGQGAFPTKAVYDAGISVREIIVEDLDNDGKADIAAANSIGSGRIAVLKRNNTGGYSAPVYYNTVSGFPYHLAATDLNGDGKKDLITSTVSGTGGNTTQEEIFLNCGPTAIPEITSANDFKLFPNPANASLTLELKSNSQNALLRVLDITGRCLIQEPFSGISKTIPVAGLASGTYLVQIMMNEQTTSRLITIRH